MAVPGFLISLVSNKWQFSFCDIFFSLSLLPGLSSAFLLFYFILYVIIKRFLFLQSCLLYGCIFEFEITTFLSTLFYLVRFLQQNSLPGFKKKKKEKKLFIKKKFECIFITAKAFVFGRRDKNV